jgi:hypothetical protein
MRQIFGKREGITSWHAMVVKMETKRKATLVGSQNKE